MTKSALNHLLVTAASLGIITSTTAAPVFAGTIVVDPSGTIYTQPTPKVLGEITSPEIDAIQAKMKAEGDALLKQYQAGEISYDELKAKKAEIIAKYKAEIQAAKQPLIEQATKEAQQTKTKIVNDATKIQVKTTQENKVRVESEPTKTTVAEPLVTDDELIFIQETPDAEQVKTRIMSQNQNKYIITNGVAAKVGTPISINLETNEMTITTPAGTKVVAVLPDAALRKARAAGIEIPLPLPLEEIDTATDTADIATTPAEITPLTAHAVELVDYQNSPTYAIKGKATKKLLGIIPVSIDKKVYISAVSGNVVDTETTGLAKLLDLISL